MKKYLAKDNLKKVAVITDSFVSKKRPFYNGGLERLTKILINDLTSKKYQVDLYCRPNFDSDQELISNNKLNVIRIGKKLKTNTTKINQVIKTSVYLYKFPRFANHQYDQIITLNYIFFLYIYFSPKKIREKSIIFWSDYLELSWIKYFGVSGFLGLITDLILTKTKRGKKIQHWSNSGKTTSKLKKAGIPSKNIKYFPLQNKIKFLKTAKKLSKKHQILMVSRLVNYKRVDLGIIIFQKIQQKHPEYKLIIIGDGPQKKYLNRLIKRMRLEKKVIIITKVSESKLNKFYAESKFFLHLSTIEGYCFVIQEAMRYHCIIIAYYLDVLKETTAGKKNVYLVKNIYEIPNLITSLI